jgi:ribosomal protein S18 acetylase RimI-like enzyme
MLETRSLLGLLERYYDTAPRSGADVEDFGPLTLFVARGAWPYYARPTLGEARAPSAGDITKVRERQRERGLPEAFEWVHETTPAMLDAARSAGLAVRELPLMVLDAFEVAPSREGFVVRLVGPEDPDLRAAHAVAHVGFSAPGTARGVAGPAARDELAANLTTAEIEHLRGRLVAGLTRMAVVVGGPDEPSGSGPLCVGSHILVGAVAEIVGVATLPSARRRGLARMVTSKLVEDARAGGAETIFLSAGGEDVARMYSTVGFVRVGTACIAEPAGG